MCADKEELAKFNQKIHCNSVLIVALLLPPHVQFFCVIRHFHYSFMIMLESFNCSCYNLPISKKSSSYLKVPAMIAEYAANWVLIDARKSVNCEVKKWIKIESCHDIENIFYFSNLTFKSLCNAFEKTRKKSHHGVHSQLIRFILAPPLKKSSPKR